MFKTHRVSESESCVEIEDVRFEDDCQVLSKLANEGNDSVVPCELGRNPEQHVMLLDVLD